MARAALILSTGEGQRVVALNEEGTNIIGRAPGSDVLLEDQTVSRRHAEMQLADGAFILENVSETNVAKINGVVIERPVRLTDGDVIELGSVRLSFHDLQAGDRISGPMCSSCGRENMPEDKDCWFDGTSMVNAPTSILGKREVGCRIVSESGDSFDVHEGEVFVIVPGQSAEVVRDEQQPAEASVRIGLGESAPELVAGGRPLTVNGQQVSSDHPLETGDDIGSEDARWIVLVR